MAGPRRRIPAAGPVRCRLHAGAAARRRLPQCPRRRLWPLRAERIGQVRTFLDEWGFADAHRRRMQGDASTRTFERLLLDDQRTILMNAARRADGPPVRDGKPYSAIAHLAEDVLPYVAVAAG